MTAIALRPIGDGHPCFITFEAGPTHDGLETAKALATHSVEAGADAIKFQILDPDRLIADRKQPFSYHRLVDRQTGATEEVTEPLYDILCRRSLTKDEWRELKAHCDRMGLAFFATISFEDEVTFLEELGCHSIKIASGDVNHVPILRAAARTGMCLQLDTGNATLDEIAKAIDIIRGEGNDNIVIHQCPSGYPARLESINLNIIRTLKDRFPCATAFSDHSPGWEMDIAAVALGANLVEKTITLDRETPSIEHIMSIEPEDMKTFVQTIRDVEMALGVAERFMGPEEMEKRKAVRRSAHVKGDLEAGHVLAAGDLEFRRPGDGIPPDEVDRLIGSKLKGPKKAGERLSPSDLGE